MLAPDWGGRLPACTAAMVRACCFPATGTAGRPRLLRYDFQGAASICQPANSQYGGEARSRPLGLVNEGTTAGFVSCALAVTPDRRAWSDEGAGRGGRFGQHVTRWCQLYLRGRPATRRELGRGVSHEVDAAVGWCAWRALTWQPSEIAGAPEQSSGPRCSACSVQAWPALQRSTTTKISRRLSLSAAGSFLAAVMHRGGVPRRSRRRRAPREKPHVTTGRNPG